jgi:hypothetical protein
MPGQSSASVREDDLQRGDARQSLGVNDVYTASLRGVPRRRRSLKSAAVNAKAQGRSRAPSRRAPRSTNASAPSTAPIAISQGYGSASPWQDVNAPMPRRSPGRRTGAEANGQVCPRCPGRELRRGVEDEAAEPHRPRSASVPLRWSRAGPNVPVAGVPSSGFQKRVVQRGATGPTPCSCTAACRARMRLSKGPLDPRCAGMPAAAMRDRRGLRHGALRPAYRPGRRGRRFPRGRRPTSAKWLGYATGLTAAREVTVVPVSWSG